MLSNVPVGTFINVKSWKTKLKSKTILTHRRRQFNVTITFQNKKFLSRKKKDFPRDIKEKETLEEVETD